MMRASERRRAACLFRAGVEGYSRRTSRLSRWWAACLRAVRQGQGGGGGRRWEGGQVSRLQKHSLHGDVEIWKKSFGGNPHFSKKSYTITYYIQPFYTILKMVAF